MAKARINRLNKLAASNTERIDVEIGGERFAFFLSMPNARIATDAGRDPIPCLFRVVGRVVEQIGKAGTSNGAANASSAARILGSTSATDAKDAKNIALAVEMAWSVIPVLDSQTFEDFITVVWWGLLEEDKTFTFEDVAAVMTPAALVSVAQQVWGKMVSHTKDLTAVDKKTAPTGESDSEETDEEGAEGN